MQVLLDVSEFQSVAQLDRLLKDADDEIVGVYIKATQGLSYRNEIAGAFAACAQAHNTDFGLYDFLTNDQANAQARAFANFSKGLQADATLRPMVDAEGAYIKYAAGVTNWATAYGSEPILYAQLSNMPRYANLRIPKWVAQYDSMSYYRPSAAEIANYRAQGYAAWQFTSNYMGLNQDASVLLAPIELLRR